MLKTTQLEIFAAMTVIGQASEGQKRKRFPFTGDEKTLK